MCLLVNLEDFSTMEVDENQLRELGMPEGFQLAEDVSIEQWIAAGRKLNGQLTDE